MSKLHLTFACGPYDRTLALRDGSVQPEGIDLNYIASQPPDIFWRMLQFKEFEISEMSLSNHATLVSTGALASGLNSSRSIMMPPAKEIASVRMKAPQ